MQDDVLERLMGAFFGGQGHGRSGDGPSPHVFVSIQGQGDADVVHEGNGFAGYLNGMGSVPFGRRPGGPPGNLKDELVIQGHQKDVPTMEAEQHHSTAFYDRPERTSYLESPTHYQTPWPHAGDHVDPLQRMFDEAHEMMESMMRVFPSHRDDDTRHSVPIDWHDSGSSSSTFTSTSSSSSFQRLADGSTESKTTTRRHDATIETVTTTCTPDNVCQTVRELLDSAGRLVAYEDQMDLKDTLQNSHQLNAPPDNTSPPNNNEKPWWKLF